MSFDVMTIKRVNETECKYEIASSCLPSVIVGEYAESAKATDTAFDHIDGVTICKFGSTGVWLYNVERDCLSLFDADEYLVIDWDDPDPQDEVYMSFNKLRKLFKDHWPTFGEIADCVSQFNH